MSNNENEKSKNENCKREDRWLRVLRLCVYLIFSFWFGFALLTGGGLNYSSGFREEHFEQKFEVLDGITCSFALYNREMETFLCVPSVLWAGYSPSRGLTVAFKNDNENDIMIKVEKIVIGEPDSGQTILSNHTLESPNNPKSFHVRISESITGSDPIIQIHLYGTIVDIKTQVRENFTVSCAIQSPWRWGILPGWLGLRYGEIPPSLGGLGLL